MEAAAVMADSGSFGSLNDRQHLVFWEGTPQELEVYKIFGRQKGPTVMIIGGIQGDEPGGFLSADLYADLAMKRGNLIVVPRANFKSIIMFNRGPDGDMNRKFEGDLALDPDQGKVEILKELMAESDLLLNLHDGSGYYRPRRESELAGPDRFGQCVIADAAVYTHPESGRVIPLEEYAQKVVAQVNRDIAEPLHKFHFFNTRTGADDSRHKEQRKSATYYALTQLGIPAFGVETSKQLPSLEMKIRQHNLAVNAFLDIFGLEVEQPRIVLDAPVMGYMVISVNDEPPIAVADGQTLLVNAGDIIEVAHIGANYDRGLSADVLGLGGFNDLRRPLAIAAPTAIVARKDHAGIGRVDIKLLPPEQKGRSPRLEGAGRVKAPKAGTPVLAAAAKAPGQPGPRASGASPGQVEAFLIEVDGRATALKPDDQLEVMAGSLVKIVDLRSSGGALPEGMVMNLKGFVPPGKFQANDGEDRGFTADVGQLMPAFSVGKKAQVYEINAEVGSRVTASCSLKIAMPKLASATLEIGGQTRVVKAGGRLSIDVGVPVKVVRVDLADGRTLARPRYTLGGRPLAAQLPQTIVMPSFAVNLAVFNGETLAGKILWAPKNVF
jgi:hypothetical protein